MSRLALLSLLFLVPLTFAQDTDESPSDDPPAVQVSEAAKEELRQARDRAAAEAARIREHAYGAKAAPMPVPADPLMLMRDELASCTAELERSRTKIASLERIIREMAASPGE